MISRAGRVGNPVPKAIKPVWCLPNEPDFKQNITYSGYNNISVQETKCIIGYIALLMKYICNYY
jgi:hypothetical protein